MAQETMTNFISKNQVWQCNQCKFRKKWEITCKLYQDRIPREVLLKNDCKEFEKEEEEN